MKTLGLLPLLLFSLLLIAACKKEKDAAPSKTALLTARAWKNNTQTLRLNNVDGTRSTAPADQIFLQLGADGKATTGPANSPNAPTGTGTWAFANNESQLTLTFNGTATTFDVFELSPDRLVLGYNYTQAQIQQFLSGNGGNTTASATLTGLLLSAGAYTWPAATPSTAANQLTSVQWRNNFGPR